MRACRKTARVIEGYWLPEKEQNTARCQPRNDEPKMKGGEEHFLSILIFREYCEESSDNSSKQHERQPKPNRPTKSPGKIPRIGNKHGNCWDDGKRKIQQHNAREPQPTFNRFNQPNIHTQSMAPHRAFFWPEGSAVGR